MTRVIIIDDEADIRTALKEVLVRAGFEVEAVSNGSDGLDLLREHGADLVVADIIMPGKNGVETVYDIRMEFPKTKIVVISGGGNVAPMDYQPSAIKTEAYLASASEAGADVTLTKPFDSEEIVKVIRQLTENQD